MGAGPSLLALAACQQEDERIEEEQTRHWRRVRKAEKKIRAQKARLKMQAIKERNKRALNQRNIEQERQLRIEARALQERNLARALNRRNNIERVRGETNMEQTILPQNVPTIRSDCFNLPDDKFVSLYRLTKPVAAIVIDLLKPFLGAKSVRKNCISVEKKVLCALRYYGCGYKQEQIVSDEFGIRMAQTSVSKLVHQVTDALNRLLKTCVMFPSERGEQETIEDGFYEYCGLSGILGAVGCTHVPLITPKDDGYHQKESFLNSKNFFSLKVQLVADSKQEILNVVASSPGSTDDAYIWKSSALRRSFTQGQVIPENSYLIGSSSYPSEPWLRTPTLLATRNEEVLFNSAHSKGMSVIKKVNGTLKSRFQCLKKENMMHYDPVTACKIVNACVILHNICIKNNLVWTHEPLDEMDELFTTASVQDQVIKIEPLDQEDGTVSAQDIVIKMEPMHEEEDPFTTAIDLQVIKKELES